jgi:D-beta-D-heptose 7-phosphate kinase/D-beta-D-heptose 1-phosphate adenosyltransferase
MGGMRADLDFSAARILVIGDVMLDHFIYGDVHRLSPEAPVPVLRVCRESMSPGGAGNVAANAAALGARVTLIGLIGDDAAGRECRAALDLCGARLTHDLLIDPSRATTRKQRGVGAGQHVGRYDWEATHAIDAAVEDRLRDTILRHLRHSTVVVLSDYAKGLCTPRIIDTLMREAAARAVPVVVDPKKQDFRSYAGATIITPNRQELGAMSGLACDGDEACGKAAAAAIRATGAAILVTRSEQGMSLFEVDRPPVHARALRHNPVDVSGAGDTVVAVVAATIGCGRDLASALPAASAAAAHVIGRSGTATATAEDIAALVKGAGDELVAREAILQQVAAWRAKGRKIGFTNGCFDILHAGHIDLLSRAAAACDHLIVGLNDDASIRRLKGASRPIQSLPARAKVLAALSSVDRVVAFSEDTPLDLITAIAPDVLVKGSDYREEEIVGAAEVRRRGGSVLRVDLLTGFSTTRIAARLAGASEAAE